MLHHVSTSSYVYTLLHSNSLEHLHNVETRFNCPRACLSLDFQCRDDILTYNRRFGI